MPLFAVSFGLAGLEKISMTLGNRKGIVAMDLDGTLFNADSEVSARSLDALDLASSCGYETVAVTGRSFRTAVDRLHPANSIEHIICSNGAYLYHKINGEIGWENHITLDALAELTESVRSEIPGACFGWESASGFRFEPAFLALAENAPELGGGADELGTEALYKLFIRSATEPHDKLLEKLTPQLRHLAELATSGAPFLEATARGTHKGSALARLAGELGVSAANTIVFGDNHNDIPMFQWAGTSVAMANAVPELHDVASDSTVSNTEHGVAEYLENYFR